VRNRKFAEAVNVVDQALADPAGRRPRFYGVLASLYRQQGRNDDGRRLFEKALQMYPEDIMLHYEYALFLDRTGNADDAFVAMQKVLVMDPHNPYALNYIGYTWADRGEKLDEARVFIEKAASLRPDDGFIRDSLGWVYFKLGQYEKALAELTRALELASDPVIFEHLGDVYAKTGQMAEALKAYQQAVSHFAEDEGRQRVEAKIKALGSESQK
ncbi:MAG: tetratricopeptide repeat protein, partial [Desulfobulbaceae bacterium]|nr:tetratricopeptide repeat protein [Desulfobulbaceae bacterium]